jgi:hypothetical protein
MKSAGPDVAAISIVKDVTKMLWDAEDAEGKALVAAKVAESQERSIEKENDKDDVRTPKQYQRYADGFRLMPHAVLTVIQCYRRIT